MKDVKFILTSLIIFLFITPLFAKNMEQMLGVGYSGNFGFNFIGTSDTSAQFQTLFGNPSISVKYWLTSDIGIQGIIGLFNISSSENDTFGFNMGGRLLYNLIDGVYSNLYIGSGLGFTIADSADNERTFLTNIQAGSGIEFFIPKLEDIAFSFELGLDIAFGTLEGKGAFLFSLDAANFIISGLHYYF